MRRNGTPPSNTPVAARNQPARVNRHAIPASFLQSTAAAPDPAQMIPGAPPNFGQSYLPHVFTVAARYQSYGRAYPQADEALRQSRQNAEYMRQEAGIMECIEGRQRATALLKWQIEPEVEDSQEQKDLAREMTAILKNTPRFTEMRRVLCEAIWYGRYGVTSDFTSKRAGPSGRWRSCVKRWEPRHGDKILFRFDDGSQDYNPEQIGIRVAAGYNFPGRDRDFYGNIRPKTEPTQYGLAYWLDEYERRGFILHKHMVEDGPYEDPIAIGRVNGVGIRDRIYWTWYAMQECLANLLIYVERSALGVEIWKFPANNPKAEEKTRTAATEQVSNGRRIVLVPVFPGEQEDLYGVDVIEPGGAGIDSMMGLIQDYFGHKIKRYILGQTLSTEADATGLGSGVADAHLATFADIIKYDAINLEETLTTDLLRPLQLWNFPGSDHIQLRFAISTEDDVPAEKMDAAKQAWEMGAAISTSDIMDIIGMRTPEEGEDALKNPALEQPMGGAMAGGLPGMPGMMETDKDGDGDGFTGDNTQQQRPNLFDADQHRYKAAADPFADVNTDPSEAQRDANNYRHGHVRLHGLRISIENPKGTLRRKEWKPLNAHYGYIRGTTGRDKDHLDCFIGPSEESEIVYVVDQVTQSGRFDEHKVVFGCTTEKQARDLYAGNYQSGWRVGPITAMTIDQFKAWLDKGDQTKRVEPQVSRYALEPEVIPPAGNHAPRRNPMHMSQPGRPLLLDIVAEDPERYAGHSWATLERIHRERYRKAEDDDGRWVTMPADGEGGGGTPVFIRGGKIEKGPAALRGKRPDELGDADPWDPSEDWRSDPKAQAADIRTQAKEWGRENIVDPKTKLDKAVADTVGRSREAFDGFKAIVEDVHKERKQRAEYINEAISETLAQVGVTSPGSTYRLFNVLKKVSDFEELQTKFKHQTGQAIAWRKIDTLVDYMRDHYPSALDIPEGDYVGKEDYEQALFDRLQSGFEPVPKPHDEEVLREAAEYANRYSQLYALYGPADWANARAWVQRYALGMQDVRPTRYSQWKEEDHPRDKAGRFADTNDATSDGRSYFSDEALEQAQKESDAYKSRSKLIYMSPEQFLSLAERLEAPTPSKKKTVSDVLDKGDKLSSIPHLSFDRNESGETAQVTGHEGRHRAMQLQSRGVRAMPVMLHSIGGKFDGGIRWDQQAAAGFDRIRNNWPEVLKGETSGEIPFPVKDPMPEAERPEYEPKQQAEESPEPPQREADYTDPIFDLLDEMGL